MTDTTQVTNATPTVATDISAATGVASVAAAASGNVALVPDIQAAGQLANLLASSIALTQAGHISASGWAAIQKAFAEAVANWNAA